MELSKQQRIEHLKLQGFTVEEAAMMQKVSINEVEKIYNKDKVFPDVENRHRFFSHSNREHTGSSK
jgi:hypothetical protein